MKHNALKRSGHVALAVLLALFSLLLFQAVQAQVGSYPHDSATTGQLPTQTIQSPPALGDFVVTDEGADALFGVTPGGVVTVVASGSPFVGPVGVAVDSGGDFIVADFDAGELFRVTPAGLVATIASGLGLISGVAIDGSGNFITVSCGLGAVLRITPGGVVTTIASGLGCLVNTPAIDGAGDIIVTEY